MLSPRSLGHPTRRPRPLLATAVAILAILLVLPTVSLDALDRVRVESNVDAAIAKHGVTGKGVLVAIMDRGIDWQNNDFRNPDGTTRIAAIYDLTDDTGALAPGNPYGKGTLYTREQINLALQGGPNLATRDAVGHGTTTAGIAAGNGRNSPGGKYRGIAPNATLLVVKITSDGAPAHDDQPAEAAYFDGSRINIAIDYIRAQAAALRMPCVMVLNIGTQTGPTDGTSAPARKIDAVVGPGIPGLVFVTGSGDEGGMPNRTGGFVPQGGTAAIQIQKGAPGGLRLDLWYPGTDRFDVTVTSPSGTFGPYASPANNSTRSGQSGPDFSYTHNGSNVDYFEALNDKREIMIDFNGPPGIFTVSLHGAVVTSGRFDGTMNPSFFWLSPSHLNRFLTFVAPGSIWDQAAARHNIVPTSYMIRTAWTNINGHSSTVVNEGNPGEIWRGSSTGPTFDGRIGVDVAAPGDRIMTTYNPKSYWATFRGNLINDGGGLYGAAGAVSAANPLVTGVIALMLEKNPRLDATTVKRLLQQSARPDGFTGATPNTVWGYGKLDVLAALDAVPALGAVAGDFDGDGKADVTVFRPASGSWFVNGSTSSTTYGWGGTGDIPAVGDYDGDGRSDAAVFRPATSTWYIRQSSTLTMRTVNWGGPGDIPVPGDYDGDGRTDVAIFRPSSGAWYVLGSTSSATYIWGGGSDIPAPADYDGDRLTDAAVFRPSTSTWYIRQSTTLTMRTVAWGGPVDIPVPGDYDGDWKADVAIFRRASGEWFVLGSRSSATYVWGGDNDIPVPADYDGDGRTDAAVFRPSTGVWYIRQSTTLTMRTATWGGAGDVPIMGRP